MPLHLSPTNYQNLLEVAQSTHDPRQLYRAQALLWLHAGDPVGEVATRLFGTPRTVPKLEGGVTWWCLRLSATASTGSRLGRGSAAALFCASTVGSPQKVGQKCRLHAQASSLC